MAISNRIQASHTGTNPSSLDEIKEQWDLYGNQALALINVSPTQLAIENSNVTKRGEDENRITLYNMGLDLQHVDEERLRALKDGHYMIAVQEAFKRGAYSQGKTSDSSSCSTMSDESVDSGTLKGVCTPFYTVVCSADSVTHSLSSCPFMFTHRARHWIALHALPCPMRA